MSEDAIWGIIGVIVSILLIPFGAKKLGLFNKNLTINGDVKGDAFIGKKEIKK